jgi:hypothetical protein
MTSLSIELFAYPWDILDAGKAFFLDLGLPVTNSFDQAAADGLLGESRLQWIQELACLARKASA